MKKNHRTSRKLGLHRETLFRLEKTELRRAAGGDTGGICCYNTDSPTCDMTNHQSCIDNTFYTLGPNCIF